MHSFVVAIKEQRRFIAFLIFCTLVSSTAYGQVTEKITENQEVFPADQTPVENGNELINSLTEALTSKSKDDRLAAIEQIANSSAPAKELWLQSLIDGSMYSRKSDKRIVLGEKAGRELKLVYADDGSDGGTVKKRSVRKIAMNNALRSKVRGFLATLDLVHPDVQIRLNAVNSLLGTDSASTIDTVRNLLDDESDQKVRQSMTDVIALYDLRSDDPAMRAAAFGVAQDKIHPEFVTALTRIAAETDDEELKISVSLILENVEQKKRLYGWVEIMFFGLSLGSVLALAAVGLAITFGVMGVINLAHGELIMLGAYTTYFIQQFFPQWIEFSLLLAVPAAFIVSGVVGILIERSVIKHLYGRALETLLATFGVSLILQQLVRTTVSSQNVAVVNPSWMSGSMELNPLLSLTSNRLIIIVFCLVLFILLHLITTRSGFGLRMRAVSQNRKMARAIGIQSSTVDALTFGLGSGIAGVAGVALSQIGNVGPNLGQNYIIDSFLVVVVGGVGNLWGTLVAGLSLGIGNKLMEPFAGAVLAKILLLVLIILFIQKRPRGLFPQRGRASES